MKEKKIPQAIAFGAILTAALAVSTVLTISARKLYTVSGDNSPYTLTLNSNNRIYNQSSFSGTSPVTGTVYTGLNNPIQISGFNIVSNSNGWQTILPNGYIYNDLTNSNENNKLSGIVSISYTGNSSLSLHYGYSLNNSEIIYTTEKTLTAGVEYTFESNETPSYFYLKNNNSGNVNINSLYINYSCTAQAYPKNNLKILMIGNSFSDDTIYYEKEIANAYGINLEIYDAYIAGCTLNTHYSNLTGGVADYSMRSMNNGSWVYNDNMTLADIIDSNTWDIITFQQASAEIGRPSTYNNLSNLVSLVRQRVGNAPKFYWYQTWAYDEDYMDYYDYFSYFDNNQLDMYNAINSCYTSNVAPLGLFSKLIPAGTAVQNMRTSYMKDTFTRDGKHMSSVHGRYLLGLNFLSNALDIDLDLSPCSYLAEGVNTSFKNIAYESIRNARHNPLAITNSVYTQTEMANYDLSSYTEIDAGFVGNSYYNSTESSNYFNRFGNVSGTSNLYTTTKIFTPSTLPVGSIVFCPEAFGYRPEAWRGDYSQASRPNESYANVLQITSDFWDGYAYRAFNIFKAGKSTLLGQFNQIFDGFKIFVPTNKLTDDILVKNANTYSAEDRALFTAQYVNFDSYDRVFVDPIIGFMKCDSYYNFQNSYVDDTAKKFVCTRGFYKENGDLPANTIIVCDNGYQWRSDCWLDHGTTSRPGNVSANFTRLDSSFMDPYRCRTFNFSKTNSGYVNQNAIDFANHVRIYVPNSGDVDLEKPDKSKCITFTATGTVSLSALAASVLGNSVPMIITCTGESQNSVNVTVNGSDAGATSYTYNKSTKALSISTTGSASGYTYGTITGTFNPSTGIYNNISIDGSLKQFVSNNGSISATEKWFDTCSYSTEAAANQVWQRWYGSTWTANSGNNNWTMPNQNFVLENQYSLGLRIASSSNSRTRFTLKNDLGNGSGLAIKGFSVWFYNPNGAIYSNFRIFVYTTPSSNNNGVNTPSSTYQTVVEYGSSKFANAEWVNVKVGWTGTAYNISLFFQSSSSENTYIYMGHISLY